MLIIYFYHITNTFKKTNNWELHSSWFDLSLRQVEFVLHVWCLPCPCSHKNTALGLWRGRSGRLTPGWPLGGLVLGYLTSGVWMHWISTQRQKILSSQWLFQVEILVKLSTFFLSTWFLLYIHVYVNKLQDINSAHTYLLQCSNKENVKSHIIENIENVWMLVLRYSYIPDPHVNCHSKQ